MSGVKGSGVKGALNVALVQTDIAWLKPLQNMKHLEQVITTKVDNADLIILPETFATGFAFDKQDVGELEQGPIFNWLQQMAKTTGAVMVGSVAVNSAINSESKNANRMYWVRPDGSFEYYDKRHLFRMGNEHHHVVAGNERKVFEVKGFRLLPLVCYDLRFPVWSRNKNDYDVMVNVANWPGVRRKPWDILLQARAIENQCYVLAVNRVGEDGKGVGHSGGTAIYDFKGDTLLAAKDNQAEVLQYTLELDELNQFKENFPAHLDADDFEIL